MKRPGYKAELTSGQFWETSMAAFVEVKYHVQKRRRYCRANTNSLTVLDFNVHKLNIAIERTCKKTKDHPADLCARTNIIKII